MENPSEKYSDGELLKRMQEFDKSLNQTIASKSVPYSGVSMVKVFPNGSVHIYDENFLAVTSTVSQNGS